MSRPSKPKGSGQIVKSAAAQKIVGQQNNGSGGAVVRRGTQGFISTFTPIKGVAIVEGVERGMPYTFAAMQQRVPQATASRWLKQGEEDGDEGKDTDLAIFAADIRKAQADFVQKAIDGIVDAGLDDAKQWTALMTLLERIYPEYFKRPMEKAGTNINVNVGVGFVEKRLHELHARGEIVYDGG